MFLETLICSLVCGAPDVQLVRQNGHKVNATEAVLLHGNTHLLSASSGEALLWDVRTGLVVRRLPKFDNSVLTKDGNTLVLVDGQRLWVRDARTLDLEYEATLPAAHYGKLHFLPGEGRRVSLVLGTLGMDTVASTRVAKADIGRAIFDLDKRTIVQRGPQGYPILALDDGTLVSEYGAVVVDPKTLADSGVAEKPYRNARVVPGSGRVLANTSTDVEDPESELWLVDPKTRAKKRIGSKFRGHVLNIAVSPDGQVAAVATFTDVTLYDLVRARKLNVLLRAERSNTPNAVSPVVGFSPDSQRVVTGGQQILDNSLSIFDRKGVRLTKIDHPGKHESFVIASPRGHAIYVFSSRDSERGIMGDHAVYDVTTGVAQIRFTTYGGHLARFSLDGAYLETKDNQEPSLYTKNKAHWYRRRIYEVATGKLVSSTQSGKDANQVVPADTVTTEDTGHLKAIFGGDSLLAFNRDASLRAVLGSMPKTGTHPAGRAVIVWETKTNKRAISPPGRRQRLVLGAGDRVRR